MNKSIEKMFSLKWIAILFTNCYSQNTYWNFECGFPCTFNGALTTHTCMPGVTFNGGCGGTDQCGNWGYNARSGSDWCGVNPGANYNGPVIATFNQCCRNGAEIYLATNQAGRTATIKGYNNNYQLVEQNNYNPASDTWIRLSVSSKVKRIEVYLDISTMYTVDDMQCFSVGPCTTSSPTKKPTKSPTPSPTPAPTNNPTPAPTNNPTPSPTSNPTHTPTINPTKNPTPSPTTNPTKNPTNNPSKTPTNSPTISTLNPTKNPTLNPTLLPSISPSKNPTISPTLPEGAVHDVTGDGDYDNTGENNSLQSEKVSNGGSMMIFIIVGAIGVCVICCIIAFGLVLYKKRNKKRLGKQNGVHTDDTVMEGKTVTTMPNSSVAMIQLGSVSPRSMNSIDFNPMSFCTTGGAYEGDTNDNDNENEDDESDDGDNELFGVTGATAGGDNEIQLPELPDNNDENNEESETQNDMNNELYKKEMTTGGRVDMELYENVNKICKLCDQCGKSVDVKDGKEDENDGNWYCQGCWDSFYQ